MSPFTPSLSGSFMQTDGPARAAGRQPCQHKLCFAATDRAFLDGLLGALSEDDECYFVKYSVNPRDGMYLGRCFMATAERVGRVWRDFKGSSKVLCTIQDDGFVAQFRDGKG